MQFRVGETRREREGDDAAAGSDVEHARVLRPGEVAQIFDQLLGLGTGDERSFVGDKGVLREFYCPEEMLEGLALAAPPDEVAKRGELGLVERALEVELELDPLLA